MVTGTLQNGTITVVLNFASETLPPKKYYFTVRVTEGNNTIIIEGNFSVVKGKLYDRLIN